MSHFLANRTQARKILLEKCDVISFRNVPHFIADAFFGQCTYNKRLIACTFCYLNGLSPYQLFQLHRWSDFKKVDHNKIEALLRDFEQPAYQAKYYSYNVHHGLVMFLNGHIRKNSK